MAWKKLTKKSSKWKYYRCGHNIVRARSKAEAKKTWEKWNKSKKKSSEASWHEWKYYGGETRGEPEPSNKYY
jgi:hypothetical protein